MHKNLIQIDQITGEQLEGILVWVPKQRSIYGKRWLQMSQEPLVEIAKDHELRGRPTSVLLYLLSILDFENYIQIPQTQIARELGFYRSDVSSIMSLLQKKGILLQGPKVGHSRVYRLNPYYGWKGKTSKLATLHKVVEK